IHTFNNSPPRTQYVVAPLLSFRWRSMLKELMGLWSSGLPSALRSEATTVRGMSPRKQVTSVQPLGRGFGHASGRTDELIPSAPTTPSPVAVRPYEKVAVPSPAV